MTLYSTPAPSSDLQRAWRSLADSRFLSLSLLGLGTFSNVIYAHTPLVAFAVISGIALPRQRAIAVALLIWLVNQVIGFGIRDYPLEITAFTWGLIMGIGTLIVVAGASLRPRFSQSSWLGHGGWVAIALVGGFALYQGLIMLSYPMLADGHSMGWDIVAKLFLKQLTWTGAIALGHAVLLWRQVVLLRSAHP